MFTGGATLLYMYVKAFGVELRLLPGRIMHAMVSNAYYGCLFLCICKENSEKRTIRVLGRDSYETKRICFKGVIS